MIKSSGDKSAKMIVSAIVPIYNEEKMLNRVIDVLLSSELIDEVICVNDGSTDNSLKLLQQYGPKIKLINLEQNRGKGYALVAGIKKAKGKIVCFVDADLINLEEGHLKTLLKPILAGKTRGVLGYPMIFKNGLPSLTGERAYYKKDLKPLFKEMVKSRFGVEVLVNDYYLKNNFRTTTISLKGLRGLWKQEKTGYLTAFKEYTLEFGEILKELGRQRMVSLDDYRFVNELTRILPLKELRQRFKRLTSSD